MAIDLTNLPRSTKENPFLIFPPPRTTPYSVYTTPRRSYSALLQNTGDRNMYSAIPSGGQATTTSPNAFAAGMQQGAKNVYAKPAFVKPQQKSANVPPVVKVPHFMIASSPSSPKICASELSPSAKR